MYTREEASKIKEAFWTAFGRYMAIHTNSEGKKINWMNYHSGYKDVYFRMDADKKKATISIQLRHKDELMRQLYYEKFWELETILHETLGEVWKWVPEMDDEFGRPISKIYAEIDGVNVFKQDDWNVIVEFFKPRIIALDAFWNEMKDHFEELL